MSIALKLQRYQAKDYNGLVTDTHFNTLYQQEPQLIDDTIHMISRVALQSEYASFVNKFPVMEVDQENNFYEWMLQGDHEKNLPLLKAYDAGGQAFTALSKTGIGVSKFYLVYSEAYFEPDNIISSSFNFVKSYFSNLRSFLLFIISCFPSLSSLLIPCLTSLSCLYTCLSFLIYSQVRPALL